MVCQIPLVKMRWISTSRLWFRLSTMTVELCVMLLRKTSWSDMLARESVYTYITTGTTRKHKIQSCSKC